MHEATCSVVGAVVVQAAKEAGDPSSYHCSSLRLMPLSSIDPSLAIGFFCKSAGNHLTLWNCCLLQPCLLHDCLYLLQ